VRTARDDCRFANPIDNALRGLSVTDVPDPRACTDIEVAGDDVAGIAALDWPPVFICALGGARAVVEAYGGRVCAAVAPGLERIPIVLPRPEAAARARHSAVIG
jgi:hypothetical protein